jgi:FHA domain
MSDQKIRITEEDLRTVDVPKAEAVVVAPAGGGPERQWGTVSGEPTVVGTADAKAARGGFLLKAWVYLGLAGAAGAFLAWAIAEPGFVDGAEHWGNFLMFPLVVMVMSIGFAIAESIVERSAAKAIKRGALALVLGLVLSLIFCFVGNLIFTVGCSLIAESGGKMIVENPALWMVRAVGWAAFGVCGGLVYGIVGQSWKKCLFGVLGGMLGGAIGGGVFDPISMLANGAEASRCIGFVIFAVMTGVAVGLVESALKSRWLYVAGGPLAGKQFILYKQITQIGSQQTNDIYLFKDLSISPIHATIELRGSVAILLAIGPTFIGGLPVTQQALRSGDLIQIGRYSFQYQEKKTQN